MVAVPLAGGPERLLPLVGAASRGSLSEGLVLASYRTDSQQAEDLVLWDLSTNLVRRLTNTPDVNETLGDIGPALPNGSYTITWTSDETGFDGRNIRAAYVSRCRAVLVAGIRTPSPC